MPFRYALPIIVVIITGAILGPVCGFHFLSYDDSLNIYENPYVTNLSAANLLRFWQAPFAQLYIPVTYSAWSFLAGLSRLFFAPPPDQVAPFFFHTTNLILHLGNTLLVLTLVQRLCGKSWAAGAGALLFALHPVQVEAVAWATGLKDLLSGLFSLLALSSYVAFCQEDPTLERRWGWRLYALGSLSLIAALLAKPGAVVVPGLAAIIGYGLLQRPPRRLAEELLPWLVLTLPIIIITKAAQADGYQGFAPSLWQRLLIASDSLSFYLGKILWPALLTIDYGRIPLIVLQQKLLPLTVLCPWLLGSLLWTMPRRWQRPVLLSAALIFALAILPVSGIIPFSYQGISTVADRYLYLAMLGPALACACFLRHYGNRFALAVFVIALLGWGAKSSLQLRHWQDSESFYRHAIAANPQSWFAFNNYGRHLQKEGRLPEAEIAYRSAIAINPFYARAYNNLGTLLQELERDDEAIVAFRQALQIAPDNEDPYLNIGNIYRDDGRWPEAMQSYRQAVTLRPDLAVAQAYLGLALKKMGRLPEALTHLQKAITLNPNFAEVHNNLGIVYKKLGQPREAVAAYRQAITLKDDFVEAHNNLGHLYLIQGLFKESLPFLKRAAALAPDQPVPQDNLGQAYTALGRHREALAAFWQAIKADATYLPARKNLARLQEELEKETELEPEE